MSEFWVVGGVYKNTRFDEIAEAGAEERHGPFWSYRDAEREWQRLSWRNVDYCRIRYQIVEEVISRLKATPQAG